MPRHSFDSDADGIELSSDILIYSYYPGATTPQEALARLAASSSRSYLQPGMEFRISRQRPNTALWDVQGVGKIWYLGTYQGYVAFTLDAATAAAVQETGSVPLMTITCNMYQSLSCSASCARALHHHADKR